MDNRFSYVKRGYDPEETDIYIETIERELKSYKEKDSSIKNAILNAQIAADGIILNAKNESASIKENAMHQVKEIRASISTQRALLNEFHAEYNQMIDKYLHKVKSDDFSVVTNKINELENYIDKFAKQSEPPKSSPSPNKPKKSDLSSAPISAEEMNALKS